MVERPCSNSVSKISPARHVILGDAGTEVNQEPGTGPDQAPRQKAPNIGMAENGVVRSVQDQLPSTPVRLS
jgi:hypothetical protein